MLSGAVYNITNQQPQRLAEMVAVILNQQMNYQVTLQSVPYGLLTVVDGAMEQLALASDLAPFELGYELPGSEGEVLLVPLPGHAVGHCDAFIQTDEGWVLLASDAAWSPVSYQTLPGPSRIANLLMDKPVAYY